MTEHRLPILLVAAALLLSIPLLAVVVGGSAGAASAVRIELADFSIKAPATLPAGEVSLETVNAGKVEHELLILRTDRAAGDLPLGLEGPSLSVGADLVLGTPHTHPSAIQRSLRGGAPRHIQPTQTRRDKVTLTPGKYVLLCNLPGHYEAGQYASLVVR